MTDEKVEQALAEHERGLNDQLTEIVELRGQIADLKKDIANLLVLSRCLFQGLSGPPLGTTSENARAEFLKLLPEMNKRYGIKYPA